ncbi:hypothetical protein RB595_003763 [Gaeumannomyces hyphopodioides]
MRLAWYAGASTALAGAVVASAFHQRANFYSAMVHLSQSNISIMIVVNVLLLVYTGFVYGLQRLCFGQLRPVEVEQLYDKGWIAVTETCLAMTLFKDDLGAFSMIMFTALLTGKVWAWIGDGRVEILEQQPPANPRLFHARLIGSLAVSIFYNFTMCLYATRSVVRAAEFGMMVMFLFEFAILLVSSTQTSLRYVISLHEQRVLKAQMQHGLETRRRHIREQRADMLRRRESGEATEAEKDEPLPDENDVEEMDIEVPGWESKGHWILLLDLVADFVKLALYSVFFLVLAIFSGLPLHIMRDLFMTARSFIKRLGALLRYRQAVKDLGRYPDATEEDLARENTCIICREEMRPWNPDDDSQVERIRPKKLPCGHILHFGCLKSWLERQQVCPTCRRSVVMDGAAADGNRNGAVPRPGGGAAPNGMGAGPAAPGAPNNQQRQQPQQGRPNVRMFNFGPIRLGFAQGAPEDFQDMAQMMGVPRDAAAAAPGVPAQNAQPAAQPQPVATGVLPNHTAPSANMTVIQAQLRAIERNIQNETISLRLAENEAQTLRLLIEHIENIRIRHAQHLVAAQPTFPVGLPVPLQQAAQGQPQPAPAPVAGAPHQPAGPLPPQMPPIPPNVAQILQRFQPSTPVTRHVATPNAAAIPSGSPDLPEGVTIPPGWTLLPLQRSDLATPAGESSRSGQGQTATQLGGGGQAPQLSPNAPGGTAAAPSSRGDTLLDDMSSGSPSSSTSTEDDEDEGWGGEGLEPVGDQDLSSGAAAPEQDPGSVPASSSSLPVWGGSAQLFGGSTPALGPSDEETRAGDSATAPEGDGAGKGKAKAVSVEDGKDEGAGE